MSLRGPWCLILFSVAGSAFAQDDPPDLGLLEYLGSWDESDEEWLVVDVVEDQLAAGDETPAEDGETDEQDDRE